MNYLVGEHQTIGENGSGSHGPNTVISLLHHYLEHYSMHEEMFLHAVQLRRPEEEQNYAGVSPVENPNWETQQDHSVIHDCWAHQVSC